MRKIFILIFLSGTLFFYRNLTAETIRVAYQKEYNPYSWIEDGEPKGLLVDWWKLWATKVGVDLEFVEGTTDQCIKWVVAGKADAVAGLFFQEGPGMELEYSEYIMRMNTTLLLRKGYRPKSINKIDKKIAILKNELSHQVILDKYPEMELMYFNTFENLRESIENKEVDGFLYEFPNIIGSIIDVKTPPGYYNFEVIKEDKLRPAVRAGNAELLNLLITGSAKITDAELVPIIEKYDLLKDPMPTEYIILVLLVVILILSLVAIRLFRSQRSRRRNEEEGSINIDRIIKDGENDIVEFKSSLRWDYRQEKPNKDLEKVIIKTISAFLNTKGGMLLIGVDDDGNILGLEKDYQSFKKQNRDGFILALTNLINQDLGKSSHRSIDIKVLTANTNDVCLIDIKKSDAPVFVGKGKEEAFFIRTAAASQPLSMKEAMDYIQVQWPGKSKN